MTGAGPLAGRVVVVTGGNGGIGLGLARGVAAAGADVAVWARHEGRSAAAAAELGALGARVAVVRCDVADEAQVAAAMEATVAELGPVDALFANAGTPGDAVPFTDLTLEAWHRVLATNLDGAFLCLREAARHLLARGGGGALVAVSSIAATFGAPRKAHYAAGKAAVASLARTLAVELGPRGIRCNALVPGWVDTAFIAPGSGFGGRSHDRFRDATTARTPTGRWGRPTDLEAAAAFLADPTLTFHTGDALVVDGGYSVM